MFFARMRHKLFGHREGYAGAWIVERIGKRLNLNEQQQQKLAAVQTQFVSLRASLRQFRDENRSSFGAMLNAGQFDRGQAARLFEAPLAGMNERVDPVVNTVGDFYDSLDSDQKLRVSDWWNKRHGLRHCRR